MFFYGLYFLQPHAMEKYVVTEELWIQRLVNAHALHHTNHQHAMKVTVSNKASVKICKNIYDQSNDNFLFIMHTLYNTYSEIIEKTYPSRILPC